MKTDLPSDGVLRTWHRAFRLTELPDDGTGKALEIAGRRVALFLIDGEPHALDDECPHQGASLGDGVIAGGDVTCPWHGWHFDPCSGKSTDGLDEAVELFPARVDEEGWVEVALSLAPDV